MRTRAQAGAVDTALIAQAFSIDEPQLDSLLDAPTQDLIKDFLSALTARAKDFDNLKADKLRSDLELENTLRAGESKVKALKATLSKNSQEIQDLRKALDDQRMYLDFPAALLLMSLTPLARKCSRRPSDRARRCKGFIDPFNLRARHSACSHRLSRNLQPRYPFRPRVKVYCSRRPCPGARHSTSEDNLSASRHLRIGRKEPVFGKRRIQCKVQGASSSAGG
jgi:hypothetical protein